MIVGLIAGGVVRVVSEQGKVIYCTLIKFTRVKQVPLQRIVTSVFYTR